MRLVEQTTFGDGKGNCFQAAVASVFELPLESVPNFCCEEPVSRWWMRFNDWCAERGVYPIRLGLADGEVESIVERGEFPHAPPAPCILSGENPDGVSHSTVWWNGKLHDPNPSKRGLRKPEEVIMFGVLHPERTAARRRRTP